MWQLPPRQWNKHHVIWTDALATASWGEVVVFLLSLLVWTRAFSKDKNPQDESSFVITQRHQEPRSKGRRRVPVGTLLKHTTQDVVQKSNSRRSLICEPANCSWHNQMQPLCTGKVSFFIISFITVNRLLFSLAVIVSFPCTTNRYAKLKLNQFSGITTSSSI